MVGQLSRRVLLVDDESLTRKVITSYLVAAGYVVRAAVDGLDGLQKLRGGVPDLIISDVHMPRMSGIELLNIVRKRFPQIPVILISADAPSAVKAEGGVADAYHQKSEQGYGALMQSVSRLIQEPPRQTSAPALEDRPALARSDGKGHYILQCEDCLRPFSIPHNANAVLYDLLTTCVHCGNPIQFPIVAPPHQA